MRKQDNQNMKLKRMRHTKRWCISFGILCICMSTVFGQVRNDISLNDGWKTVASNADQNVFSGFENPSFSTDKWKSVNVPHNWDAYEGYRRMLHGNKHGNAFYKKTFILKKQYNKRYFLFFEGVGSYATVWLNGKLVGKHAGGRTTFTIDISKELRSEQKNYLAVKADHPSNISDLPWVCGGCSDERGFSEGSQPMGIFRPVHLIITNEARVEPFGVHIWNDSRATDKSTSLYLTTTIKNYSDHSKQLVIVNKLINHKNQVVAQANDLKEILPGSIITLPQTFTELKQIKLWNLENPYLYHLETSVFEKGKLIDLITTDYGIRTIKWDRGRSNLFLLNGKPVFINGIAEYEHLLGNSHAFSSAQIQSRATQIKQLGFNAFRDGHQPHNLRYQTYWDSLGILWWTQFSAHVWYDTKEFRDGFKTLLKEWVMERRNSPSIILWGLQNESKLPKDFAEECSAIIRNLDPTASSQRLITTCNGGEGTDWDVPQNWTGTYGGNPATYHEDLKRQVLIGEYGAWRTLDLHTEGNFKQNAPFSEDRMVQLMETKIRLAEQVKDSAAGHFFWLLTSHDNPGRMQGGEAVRELDRIGPVNYKGLLTPWEEPTDAYYMFKSNYASKLTDPMVYIVSHGWPNRWMAAGKKDSIIVYSNCDEVELFNDVNHQSLGRKKNNGIGTHFQWDAVPINYNVLYAIGYINGTPVVKDQIVLNHLPIAPHFDDLYQTSKNITQAQPNLNYLYRVNCGGADYKDAMGQQWMADKPLGENGLGSSSWSNSFQEIPAFFASQRRTNSPIIGTKDWPLFQNFRYGLDQLKYNFPLTDGEYLVELYFIEPWVGIGTNSNCTGMRLFDVAFNGQIVLKDLDIWKTVGSNRVYKKMIKTTVKGGKLEISFPNVRAGQAIISAIAIASADQTKRPAIAKPFLRNLKCQNCTEQSWLDLGNQVFNTEKIQINQLPSNLFGADWIQLKDRNTVDNISFSTSTETDLYLAAKGNMRMKDFGESTNTEMITDEEGGATYYLYHKRVAAGKEIQLSLDQNNLLMAMASNHMQPAYDLKTVLSFKPLQAKIWGEAIRTSVNTRDAIQFMQNGASVDWSFNIGAADMYSITIRYANETGKKAQATMELLAADGTVMKTEQINFTASLKGKWNYIVTNSGSMINAGNYIIKIKSTNAIGVSLSALDIQ